MNSWAEDVTNLTTRMKSPYMSDIQTRHLPIAEFWEVIGGPKVTTIQQTSLVSRYRKSRTELGVEFYLMIGGTDIKFIESINRGKPYQQFDAILCPILRNCA